MENKHKEFKPFDKVLVRYSTLGFTWHCDIYSHYNKNSKGHVTLSFPDISDIHILPYEGNEHLVGTANEPYEEIKLKVGEWGFASDKNIDSAIPKNVDLIQFLDISCGKIQSMEGYYYKYFIHLSDFNPNDLEETKKHVLCIEDDKIVRYKG